MALIEGVDVESRGQGPDLVILHSLLADRSAFDRVAPMLASRHRLWLVNLPGYGASPAGGRSVEDYADQMAGLIAALKLERPAVLGNGFGGFIGVALAARHPGRVGKLIAAPALAAFPAPGKQPLRMLAERVGQEGMAAVLDAAIRRMFPERFIAAHPEVVEERKRSLAAADPASFRTACLAVAAVDLSPVLDRIKCPTLVLGGSEDATTPAALARALAGKIPGAQFRELQGCGHCPQIENPPLYAEAVEGFLNPAAAC